MNRKQILMLILAVCCFTVSGAAAAFQQNTAAEGSDEGLTAITAELPSEAAGSPSEEDALIELALPASEEEENEDEPAAESSAEVTDTEAAADESTAGGTTSDEAAPDEEETGEEAAGAEESEPLPDPPAAPELRYPQGELAVTGIGFYWTPSENADSYEILLKSESGYEETLTIESDDWTCEMGRCILYTELPGDGSYTWTVTAINPGGSAASEEMGFSVRAKISAPDAYRPNSTLNNQRPLTFEWEDKGGAVTSYRIQVVNAADDGILLDQWYNSNDLMHVNGECYLETKRYLPSGSFVWRVQAANDASVSDWSAWTAFMVSCTECNLGTYQNTSPNVIAPLTTVTDLSPVFVWQTLTGARAYLLTAADAEGNELLSERIPSSACTIEICTYDPEKELTVGEQYTWSVSALGYNDSFWGSSEGTFITAAVTEMNAMEFVCPEDSVILDPDNQQAIWTDPGAQTAAFRVGVRDSAGEWLFIGDLTREDAWCDGVTCSIQFRTIPEGDGYELFVVPYSEFNIPGMPISMTFSSRIPEEADVSAEPE